MAVPTIFFPRSLFPPRKVMPDIMPVTSGGGRAITSLEQVPTVDAGSWQITLDEVPFASSEQKRVWRNMGVLLRGRKNTCAVPIYATDTTPWPLDGEGNPIMTQDIVPHSDGSYFSDGVGFRTKVIYATVGAGALAGSTALIIDVVDGTASPLQPGHFFSISNRLYGIKKIISMMDATGVTSYSVSVLPPLREDVAEDAEVEFDDPRCICRLQTDTELRSGVDDYANATLARVTFVEALFS